MISFPCHLSTISGITLHSMLNTEGNVNHLGTYKWASLGVWASYGHRKRKKSPMRSPQNFRVILQNFNFKFIIERQVSIERQESCGPLMSHSTLNSGKPAGFALLTSETPSTLEIPHFQMSEDVLTDRKNSNGKTLLADTVSRCVYLCMCVLASGSIARI